VGLDYRRYCHGRSYRHPCPAGVAFEVSERRQGMIPSARELADANGISVRQVAETVGESISGVCCGDEIRAMRVDGRSEIWVTTAFLTSGDAVRRISRHLRIPTDVAAALRGAALTGRFPSDRDDAADRTVCRRVLDMHRATSVARQSGFKFQLDGRRWMDGRSWVFSLYQAVEKPDSAEISGFFEREIFSF